MVQQASIDATAYTSPDIGIKHSQNYVLCAKHAHPATRDWALLFATLCYLRPLEEKRKNPRATLTKTGSQKKVSRGGPRAIERVLAIITASTWLSLQVVKACEDERTRGTGGKRKGRSRGSQPTKCVDQDRQGKTKL